MSTASVVRQEAILALLGANGHEVDAAHRTHAFRRCELASVRR